MKYDTKRDVESLNPSATCFNKLFEIKTLEIGYRIDRFSHLSKLCLAKNAREHIALKSRTDQRR